MPSVTQDTAVVVDLDLIERNRTTVLVLQNYVTDNDTIPRKYLMAGVTTNYYNNSFTFTSTNEIFPSMCTHLNIQTIKLPYAFFCLNQTDGSIYTTKALRYEFDAFPDDTFHISVRVCDDEIFPPRTVFADVTVTFKSVCKQSLILGRRLYDDPCVDRDRVFTYPFHNVPSKSVNGNKNVVFPFDLSYEQNEQKSSQYYIVGVEFQLSENFVFNASYASLIEKLGFMIKVKEEQYRAVRSFSGLFIRFESPVPYLSQNNYTVEVFSTDSGTPSVIVPKFYLVLIEQKNYCSSNTCIALYEAYKSSWEKDMQSKKGLCRDYDSFGFNAKYGYCNGKLYPEAYLKPCQKSTMKLFAGIVSDFQPLTIFTKNFLLDVSQASANVTGMSFQLHV